MRSYHLLTRLVTSKPVRWGLVAAMFLATVPAQVSAPVVPTTGEAHSAAAKVQVPNRPSSSLFQGTQGRQRTEIHLDPSTGIVTIKMLVQDPNGYFIPNIRRENFAVYENGARQQNTTVEIEHAPVAVGLLLEYGGRYQALNKSLGQEISRAASAFLDEIGRNDEVAVWKYGDTTEEIAGFSQGLDRIEGSLLTLATPPFSELNLYDAVIATLPRLQARKGRKALILVSSGIDTFSKANYQDVLRAVHQSDVPVYVINLGPALHRQISLMPPAGPYARLDWTRAQAELQEIANASGGRMYSPEDTFDLAGIYDDLMENLRVRYVITYKSSSGAADLSAARTVRVELVDPTTGDPLRIVDANGRAVPSSVFFEDRYIPQTAGEPDAKSSSARMRSQ